MGKLTKNDLIKQIATHHGLSQDAVRTPIEDFLSSIVQAVADGDDVVLHGFGTFKARQNAARVGRNLHTKQAINIPASRSLSFKAAKATKTALN